MWGGGGEKLQHSYHTQKMLCPSREKIDKRTQRKQKEIVNLPVVDFLFVLIVQVFTGDVINHSSGHLLAIHRHPTARFLFKGVEVWRELCKKWEDTTNSAERNKCGAKEPLLHNDTCSCLSNNRCKNKWHTHLDADPSENEHRACQDQQRSDHNHNDVDHLQGMLALVSRCRRKGGGGEILANNKIKHQTNLPSQGLCRIQLHVSTQQKYIYI